MLTKTFVPLDQIRLFRPEGFPSPAAAAPPSPPGATTVINNQSHSSFFLSLRKKNWNYYFIYKFQTRVEVSFRVPLRTGDGAATAAAATLTRRRCCRHCGSGLPPPQPPPLPGRWCCHRREPGGAEAEGATVLPSLGGNGQQAEIRSGPSWIRILGFSFSISFLLPFVLLPSSGSLSSSSS